jgi:two-component system, NarL family, sensor histidine kinase UhpB
MRAALCRHPVMRALRLFKPVWWNGSETSSPSVSDHRADAFLSTLPAGAGQRRLGWSVVLVSAVIFAAMAPFAQTQLAPLSAFIPAYQSAIVVNDLITAVLLFGQYSILGSVGLAVLASGYLVTARLAATHMMTFPGLFAPAGLLGAGPQTTAWLYMFWHATFPLAVITYARTTDRQDATWGPRGRGSGIVIAGCVLVAVVVACVLALVVTKGIDQLPPIMQDHRYSTNMPLVVTSIWLLNAIALLALWKRRMHSILDVWLMVAIFAWLLEIALAAGLNGGRFDLGFYAGRVYGLLASTFVLLVLLLENGVLYTKLAEALDGERRERRRVQEKTAELDALNQSLEHRVAARTTELDASNRHLQQQIGEREQAETALQQSKQELHEIAAVGATAREQEKQRIARELHDDLLQSLSTLAMELNWLREREAARDEASEQRVLAMQKLLVSAVVSTRRIAADLRPLVLDDLGLIPAIEWLLEKISERYGIDCTIDVEPQHLDLADPYATAVFRIAQEALANVARHANASRVEVRLAATDRQIRLCVRDNGRGFDVREPRKANSFGLVGLRERAHLIHGELQIESTPERGTSIELHIPLPPPDRLPAHPLVDT